MGPVFHFMDDVAIGEFGEPTSGSREIAVFAARDHFNIRFEQDDGTSIDLILSTDQVIEFKEAVIAVAESVQRYRNG